MPVLCSGPFRRVRFRSGPFDLLCCLEGTTGGDVAGNSSGADAWGSYEETLRKLGRDLRQLRQERRAPSYDQICIRGKKVCGEQSAWSKASMSGVFAGRRGPASLDRLLWLVRALLSYDDGEEVKPPERRDPQLRVWKDWWDALEDARAAARRTPAANDTKTVSAANGVPAAVIARSDAPERESGPRGATGTQTVPPGASCSPSLGESALRAHLAAGKPVQLMPFPSEWGSLFCLGISPDDALVAAGSTDGVVRLWNAVTRERVGEFRTGHDVDVYTVQFSPDGTLLAAGIADGVVRIWKVAAREPVDHPPFGQIGAVHAVAFSHDGTRLAVAGADLMVRLWNPATGQLAGELPTGHDRPVYAVAFSPDGVHLATGSAEGGPRLWNGTSGQPEDKLVNAPLGAAVRAVSFSPPDGALLAAAGDDGVVRLWNMGSRQPVGDLLTGCDEPLRAVAFSPDGSLLASAGDDGVVRLWNPATGQSAGNLPTCCDGPLRAVAFSSDGTLLTSAGDDGVVHRWALRVNGA
ncbi:WD40 repeat domain-containing protein [Streptomyces sp. NPDC001817]|uniref:WD40 repeat domain-containing protein n=1 Tax=Streptomyces sp. NPDC001817 TaxID=3154398 RepID=UPI00332115E0